MNITFPYSLFISNSTSSQVSNYAVSVYEQVVEDIGLIYIRKIRMKQNRDVMLESKD